MAKRIDITGMKFGRLTVMDYHHTDASQYACWRCRCDCGKVVVVPGKSLRTGNTKSCGCLNIDAATERIISFNTTHSGAQTRLFRIWSSIKTRCENPNAINYKDYGGRGIKLCEEWHTFELFRDWALANGEYIFTLQDGYRLFKEFPALLEEVRTKMQSAVKAYKIQQLQSEIDRLKGGCNQ